MFCKHWTTLALSKLWPIKHIFLRKQPSRNGSKCISHSTYNKGLVPIPLNFRDISKKFHPYTIYKYHPIEVGICKTFGDLEIHPFALLFHRMMSDLKVPVPSILPKPTLTCYVVCFPQQELANLVGSRDHAHGEFLDNVTSSNLSENREVGRGKFTLQNFNCEKKRNKKRKQKKKHPGPEIRVLYVV